MLAIGPAPMGVRYDVTVVVLNDSTRQPTHGYTVVGGHALVYDDPAENDRPKASNACGGP